ncbi:MAG: hypothetical protein JOY61_22300 [Chloroflexi bacterium]|nr:hypothetical protein [Chloroflexota bacterium]
MAEEPNTAHISTGTFKWGAVGPRARGLVQDVSPPPPPLGPLENFAPVGDAEQRIFRGNGFNTIFRPQNLALTPTDLGGPANQGPDDNVLELNLTSERLTFSKSLGSVPNRGAKDENGDIFLNGVPYLQQINDITDPKNPVGIHFEPGVWLAVPATDKPQEGVTFARMASIPHGTTINAQGVSPDPINGPPDIHPVDITPIILANNKPFRFPSQTVSNTDTFRLPQNLTNIPITQAMLDDPNSVLRDRLNGQTVTSTSTLIIATNPPPPPNLFGGGTANIAFLIGDTDPQHPAANADAVSMSAIFWIETVSEKITVPPCSAGDSVVVQGSGAGTDLSVSFYVTAPYDITADCEIDVTYTQIQYTQTVVLNFTGLSWPHVSVATLVPDAPVVVDASAFQAQAGMPAQAAPSASGDSATS